MFVCFEKGNSFKLCIWYPTLSYLIQPYLIDDELLSRPKVIMMKCFRIVRLNDTGRAFTLKSVYICILCLFLFIVDSTPPQIISCPSDIEDFVEVGTTNKTISWERPVAIDHSGNVTYRNSHAPGHLFSVGSTLVSYVFEDASLNQAECNFTVFIGTRKLRRNILHKRL